MPKPRRPAPAPTPAPIRVPAGALDYKNTTYLRTFLNERGKLRGRAVTRLSPQDQRVLAMAVKNAREMALLPCPSARSATRKNPSRE